MVPLTFGFFLVVPEMCRTRYLPLPLPFALPLLFPVSSPKERQACALACTSCALASGRSSFHVSARRAIASSSAASKTVTSSRATYEEYVSFSSSSSFAESFHQSFPGTQLETAQKLNVYYTWLAVGQSVPERQLRDPLSNVLRRDLELRNTCAAHLSLPLHFFCFALTLCTHLHQLCTHVMVKIVASNSAASITVEQRTKKTCRCPFFFWT